MAKDIEQLTGSQGEFGKIFRRLGRNGVFPMKIIETQTLLIALTSSQRKS